MLREVERFTAKEPDGRHHTVSCLQEFFRKADDRAATTGVKLFRTADGIYLKAIDELTFNILGSGRMLYKQKSGS